MGGEWVVDIFDIFIAYISWGEEGKTRPVLILEQQKTVVHVFNITTQYKNKSEIIRRNYFKINDWQQAGLNIQSYIDTNIVRDLPVIALQGKPKIGKLSKRDAQDFIAFLRDK